MREIKFLSTKKIKDSKTKHSDCNHKATGFEPLSLKD